MIPEVEAVVRAAREFVASTPDDVQAWNAMAAAVDALEIRESRAAGAPTYEESTRTWAEVVVGDEILSANTGQWYEVTTSSLNAETGKMKVTIKGSTRPILRDPSEAVGVKRGLLGDTADLFSVLWSGTTIRSKGYRPTSDEVAAIAEPEMEEIPNAE